MKTINGEKYYDENEFSEIVQNGIMQQAEVLKKNLKEKRNKNNSVRELEYV